MSSGYTNCKCRDCFEIAVSDDVEVPDFCHACEDAGCEEDAECQADANCGGEHESGEWFSDSHMADWREANRSDGSDG